MFKILFRTVVELYKKVRSIWPQRRLYICVATLKAGGDLATPRRYYYSFIQIYGWKTMNGAREMIRYSVSSYADPIHGRGMYFVRDDTTQTRIERTDLTLIYVAKIRDNPSFEKAISKVTSSPNDADAYN
jgi:hypothetical protein